MVVQEKIDAILIYTLFFVVDCFSIGHYPEVHVCWLLVQMQSYAFNQIDTWKKQKVYPMWLTMEQSDLEVL
jgi:hypothetical protein